MNTAELINSLSRQPRRQRSWTPSLIVAAAALVSSFLVAVLALVWLKPRADLALSLVAENHIFMFKVAFTIAVVAATIPLVRDLSIPGKKARSGALLLALPFAAVILAGVADLALHPVSSWHDTFAHASRFDCLWQIPALSIPAFLVIALGVRYLAPTNLVATGAVVGLVAGALGAVGFALHCHDDSVAFVAFAYTLAIAETAAAGALLGPYILRWS